MKDLNEMIEHPKSTKRNFITCETPGCSENCAYAYSCHEDRMGRPAVAFWPVIGLAIVDVMAILVLSV